jgi:hypothetical protein
MTPHGNALARLARNTKLPASDDALVAALIERYERWLLEMGQATGDPDERLEALAAATDSYRLALDLALWDSEGDFLRRQSGQTKVGSSLLEEFLPYLIVPAMVPSVALHDFIIGPATTPISLALREEGASRTPRLVIDKKRQDFVIGRALTIWLGLDGDGSASGCSIVMPLMTAEIKTNLDATMWSEIAASATRTREVAPAAHCLVVTEWLDMQQRSRLGTGITDVLILRGKRTGASARASLADPDWRAANRAEMIERHTGAPLRRDVLRRFVDHAIEAIDGANDTLDAVRRGHFAPD